MVARGLLDTLRAVEDKQDDCTSVLNAMLRLSEDSGENIFLLNRPVCDVRGFVYQLESHIFPFIIPLIFINFTIVTESKTKLTNGKS